MVKMKLENEQIPYYPHNSEQMITDFLKNSVETRILCLHICFLIRGIRWKTNFVGPLGRRCRQSNMAAMN